MEKLRAKLRKNSGFTLIEMLIVVAIIAILIMVSIPMVSSALDRAKHATDAANERAAKAELLIQYLADGGKDIEPGEIYAYDAVNGAIVDKGNAPTQGYNKETTHHGTGATADSMVIFLRIDDTDKSTVYMTWATTAPASLTSNSNLCLTQKAP